MMLAALPSSQGSHGQTEDRRNLALLRVNTPQILQPAQRIRRVRHVRHVNTLFNQWQIAAHNSLCGIKHFARQGKNFIARLTDTFQAWLRYLFGMTDWLACCLFGSPRHAESVADWCD